MREHDFQFGLRASRDERGRQKKKKKSTYKRKIYIMCCSEFKTLRIFRYMYIHIIYLYIT